MSPDARPPEVSDEVLRRWIAMPPPPNPIPTGSLELYGMQEQLKDIARLALAQRAEIAGLKDVMRRVEVCRRCDPEQLVEAWDIIYDKELRALLARGGEGVV